MNIFTATGHILHSYVSVVTATARTAEKSVQLIENEIDLLGLEQQVRITSVKASLPTHNLLEQQ